jgi:metallophosphoesterase superfamily enzyme
MRRILILPDLHAPFHHPGALDILADLRRVHKPDSVVCIGDLGDQHGWSRHDRSPDAPGQADEDLATLSFCRSLYKVFPKASACVGNHDARLARACSRAGIPSRLHRTVAEVYDSPPGWQWSDSHVIDGVAFIHGEGYSGKDGALKAAKDNRVNTVIGHIHSAAGVQYSAGPFSTIWGLAVGCLVDSASIGMAYARSCAAKPVLGAGLIVDGIPMFIPMRK